MGFAQLLGNQRLKDNLIASVGRGRISHGYLITGPQGAGKHTLARLLAAAIMCNSPEKPCLTCPDCRKILADTHPDFITVDDEEKATVSVNLIRDARADMYVRPNEADKKIYMIPRAMDMRTEAQNALLKVLEEPPAYGVFLLLADNPEKLLPTVRSRCVELKMQSLPPEILQQALKKEFPQAGETELQGAISRSGGYLGQAKKLLQQGENLSDKTRDFVKSYADKDAVLLMQTLVPMEKLPRPQLMQELYGWKEILQQALTYRSGMQAQTQMAQEIGQSRSAKEILSAIRQLDKADEYLRGNASCGAVCGYLAWALR